MTNPADTHARPLVSVVMIFFQAERFIVEAIESVIAQSYPHWELLLVDDGSTDAGTALARGYADRFHGKVRYLQHPDGVNRGMAASRNLGMTEACGTVFAFLDADDVWLPQRLERHLTLLSGLSRPAVVIGSDLYWYSWANGVEGVLPVVRDRVVTVGVTDGAVFDPPDLLELMVRPRLAATPGICSVTFDRAPGDLPPEIDPVFVASFEDQCLCAVLLTDRLALVVDEPLAKYRQHPWSSTARALRAGRVAADGTDPVEQVFLDWLRRHLERCGRMRPSLERALAQRGSRGVGPTRSALRVMERSVIGTAFASLPRSWALALRAALTEVRERLRRRRIRGVERTRC